MTSPRIVWPPSVPSSLSWLRCCRRSPRAAPKSGGTLNITQREDLPQGFAIHETSTISTVWPAMPCFTNLVLFDPLKKVESADTVIGELAEKWAWQDDYRNLVFTLRKGVKWHDGQPFTSKDVKFTFDMLREAPDAPAKLRINPRKDWYSNVEAVEAPEPTRRCSASSGQPSLLLMLASGYSPVYAAHVPPASYRTGCVGTGPFKLKEWRKGEFVDYVKNPDYFVKGRPYLDGLRYVVIVERGTRVAALQAGPVDVSFPGETQGQRRAAQAGGPRARRDAVQPDVNDNFIMNTKKPPFDNVKVRLAVSQAIDRRGVVQAVHQGGACRGSMAPKPYGVWGLLDKDLALLPGYGKAEDDKAKARKLLAEVGVQVPRTRSSWRWSRGPRDLPRPGVLRHQRTPADRRGGDPQEIQQRSGTPWRPATNTRSAPT